MSTKSRNRSGQVRHGRRSSALIPIAATAGLFALVLGVVFYAASPPETSPAANPTQTETPAPLAANSPAAETAPLASTEAKSDTAIEQPAVHDTTVVTTAVEVDEQPLSPRELVEAQLAAGEFGPALETANAVASASERAHLFQRIADAQSAAGEFNAALRAIRRIPFPEQQASARGRRAVRRTLAGGGSMADFESLIELIQQETSGPWMEVDGTGGTITEYETGVRVDPNGMLHRLTRKEQTSRLKQLGDLARVAALNDDMARASDLRLVSLTRLERQVARRLQQGQPVVSTMKHLAGLSAIQYVFVYPDSGEIVIGGPAEGWRFDERGLARGIDSGRPTLQLDDLVTVLRTFADGGDGFFNCLIVPRPENLKALEAYVAKSNQRGPLPAGGAVRNWVRQLENLLGEQDVVVNGIPLDSRVARVIVEADYRMKLIGINKLNGGDIRSYFDLLPVTGETGSAATVGLRWWLQMKYDAVLHSADRNLFEVRGSSVQCLSEDEKITADGQRIHTGQSSPTNRLFAQEFTNHYAELAEQDVVFADLKNVMDLSLVAALIRHEQLDQRAGWNLGVFGTGGDYHPARYQAPLTVPTVANHRVYNGKDIVVQVAGGVRADLMSVVQDETIVRPGPRLESIAKRGKAPQLPHGRWWWDAAK